MSGVCLCEACLHSVAQLAHAHAIKSKLALCLFDDFIRKKMH